MSYLTQMLGADRAELRFGRDGHGGAGRAHSRLPAHARRDDRQLLGRSHALDALHPAAAVDRRRVLLVSQGVVQTFSPYQTVRLVQPVDVRRRPRLDAAGKPVKDEQGNAVTETATAKEQTLAVGPAASQVAIKQLGTNGGGFFNVNSAHPFENPTPLSNFLEMLSILLIPAALCYTFGALVGDTRQGWAVLAAMTSFSSACCGRRVGGEPGNPLLAGLGVDQAASEMQPGGNMEGKETRFGIANSALWATATTAASNGSVNSMHDSYTPLGGLVPMWLMQLGEVVFGGVGSGPLRHAGVRDRRRVRRRADGRPHARVPRQEDRGFRDEDGLARHPRAAARRARRHRDRRVLPQGVSSVANPGPHGFSEILYAFSSAGNNNGSAFAGLSANTPFYNTALGLAMWFSRYWLMIPVLAIAGSLAAKKTVPPGPGTLPTHTPLFVVLLIFTVLLVGALTFIPASRSGRSSST